MKLANKIFGDPNEKVLKAMQPLIDQINDLEPEIEKLDGQGLKGAADKLRQGLAGLEPAEQKKKMDEMLPRAFALAREAAKRELGQRHYDVQLIGGIVLHRGQIGEMKTGEGKTLVATLPLFLNALAGRGAHLVTVNDYLARVGAGWMAPVYHRLGLSTGVVVHESGLLYDPEYSDDSQYDERLRHFRPVSRQEAYRADITYGTNNEFGFDYLRDNMVQSLDQMVQRELFYVIVDEIDSILIDEARTPLIISAPAEGSIEKYAKFAQLVRRLKENDPSGGQGQGDYNIDEKMRAATLTEEGISKMEKWLGVDNIYTSGGIREVHHIEQALKAYALFQRDRDYVVKDGQVIIVDEFTGRLMHGRRYSEGLHQAIEAKEGVQVQRESQTLATITFQNFFRMYSKLSGMTGTAVTEAEEFAKIYGLDTVIVPTHRPLARKDQNDLIYRTEKGKYEAVIADVKSRSERGQPVLVGTISIEKNELLAGMMERNGLKPNVLNAKNHAKEAQFIADAGKAGAITIATNMAGRGVDIMLGGQPPERGSREHEEWKKEHDRVVGLGGLHVVGTERHEARRIDNQLRGRAGRQGDPGSSQFFVSMEDDLMRVFGGDRMKSVMTTLKVPEDMPIENKIISRSIESAQTKVEGHNFDIRKHLVEYDDVINKHREAIYRQRRRILETSRDLKKEESEETEALARIIFDYIEQEIEQVINFHTAAEQAKDWNLEEISQVASTIFPLNGSVKKELFDLVDTGNPKLDKAQARTRLIEFLLEQAHETYRDIREKAKESGLNWPELEKAVLLRSIDTLWIEHLEAMSSVRQGIGLRGYGQRDPLIEYKKEAYRLYNELVSLIQKEVVYSIFKVGAARTAMAGGFSAPDLAQRAKQFSGAAKTMDQSSSSFSSFQPAPAGGNSASGDGLAAKEAAPPVRAKVKDASGKKVGRNDPCPCGSGRKFKKCHGK